MKKNWLPETQHILRTMTNLLIDDSDIRTLPMFGHFGFLVNGNFFALIGQWGPRYFKNKPFAHLCVEPNKKYPAECFVTVALDSEERVLSFLAQYSGAARFAPDGERPMTYWVTLPKSVVKQEDTLEEILVCVLKIARSKPAKILKRVPKRLN